MHTKHTIPEGFCQCGCGGKAPIAKKTTHRAGYIKGQPKMFIHGHHGRRPVEERFWEKVDKSGGPDACWPWLGATWGMGHGIFGAFKEMGTTHAHRVAYTLTYGPIPDGQVIRHKCDEPGCQNPRHMELGTHADNNKDMWERGRQRIVGPKGERARHAKLTDEKVLAIRQRATEGDKPVDLASEYGVSPCTIYNVINRRTWTHV